MILGSTWGLAGRLFFLTIIFLTFLPSVDSAMAFSVLGAARVEVWFEVVSSLLIFCGGESGWDAGRSFSFCGGRAVGIVVSSSAIVPLYFLLVSKV